MTKQKSLTKNVVWNFLYTGTNILFPLIITPYITRVLGASNLGEVDFAKSFVQWFVLLATFGVQSYGVRSISNVRDDSKKVNQVFTELFLINTIFSVIALIIYLILIYNSNIFYNRLSLFVVMSFSIVLNIVNIDWFYMGLEEYNYITNRNFFIKIISLVLIFLFVKTPIDYILYALITVLGIGLSGVLNLIHSRKYVRFKTSNLNFKPHLKPLGTFFSISLVINLYTNLDKTLLGFFSTTMSVAYLTRVKSVLDIGKTISNSITSVVMPRATYYLTKDFNSYKKLLNVTIKYILILGLPLTFGTTILSSEIMFILGGVQFVGSSSLLAMVSITILLSSLSAFLQQQVLVPSGNERLGLFAALISSIISIITNLTLIPLFDYTGAGIALILAESTAVLSRYIFTRKIGYTFIQIIDKSFLKYFFASLMMILPIFFIKFYISSVLLKFVLSTSVGAVTYFLALLILKEDIILTHLKKLIKH